MTRASDLAKTAEIIDTASYTFRNKIINGAMEIDQRNAGAEISPAVGSVYYLDRWMAISTAAGKFKIKQNGGSIIPPPGFINYLGITSLSAYTAGASEAFGIRQIIEGFNCADLAWGTANARPITISFWVQSSLTGTFGLGLGNNGFTRAYPASYTISSANTWEYKTITVPGDTTGTWLTSNNIGLYLTWQFGYGSSLSGTANAWNAGTAFAPTGAVSVVGTNGATFYLTGVQVEVGSVATPFERRFFGQELLLCQRYYEKSYNLNDAIGGQTTFGAPRLRPASNDFWFYVQYKTTKRANPTCVLYSNRVANAAGYIYQIDGTGAPADRIANTSSQSHSGFQFYSITGSSGGLVEWQWTADAEL